MEFVAVWEMYFILTLFISISQQYLKNGITELFFTSDNGMGITAGSIENGTMV